MRTAIFTTQKTTLTIQTTDPVQLVQMSSAAQAVPPAPINVQPPAQQVVVGAGVFKIVSAGKVIVTGDAQTRILATENDKDTGWPDTALAPMGVDADTLHRFFVIPGARSL